MQSKAAARSSRKQQPKLADDGNSSDDDHSGNDSRGRRSYASSQASRSKRPNNQNAADEMIGDQQVMEDVGAGRRSWTGACDQCHKSKRACNAMFPCSTCETRGVRCSYDRPVIRPRKSRVVPKVIYKDSVLERVEKKGIATRKRGGMTGGGDEGTSDSKEGVYASSAAAAAQSSQDVMMLGGGGGFASSSASYSQILDTAKQITQAEVSSMAEEFTNRFQSWFIGCSFTPPPGISREIMVHGLRSFVLKLKGEPETALQHERIAEENAGRLILSFSEPSAMVFTVLSWNKMGDDRRIAGHWARIAESTAIAAKATHSVYRVASILRMHTDYDHFKKSWRDTKINVRGDFGYALIDMQSQMSAVSPDLGRVLCCEDPFDQIRGISVHSIRTSSDEAVPSSSSSSSSSCGMAGPTVMNFLGGSSGVLAGTASSSNNNNNNNNCSCCNSSGSSSGSGNCSNSIHNLGSSSGTSAGSASLHSHHHRQTSAQQPSSAAVSSSLGASNPSQTNIPGGLFAPVVHGTCDSGTVATDRKHRVTPTISTAITVQQQLLLQEGVPLVISSGGSSGSSKSRSSGDSAMSFKVSPTSSELLSFAKSVYFATQIYVRGGSSGGLDAAGSMHMSNAIRSLKCVCSPNMTLPAVALPWLAIALWVSQQSQELLENLLTELRKLSAVYALASKGIALATDYLCSLPALVFVQKQQQQQQLQQQQQQSGMYSPQILVPLQSSMQFSPIPTGHRQPNNDGALTISPFPSPGAFHSIPSPGYPYPPMIMPPAASQQLTFYPSHSSSLYQHPPLAPKTSNSSSSSSSSASVKQWAMDNTILNAASNHAANTLSTTNASMSGNLASIATTTNGNNDVLMTHNSNNNTSSSSGDNTTNTSNMASVDVDSDHGLSPSSTGSKRRFPTYARRAQVPDLDSFDTDHDAATNTSTNATSSSLTFLSESDAKRLSRGNLTSSSSGASTGPWPGLSAMLQHLQPSPGNLFQIPPSSATLPPNTLSATGEDPCSFLDLSSKENEK